MVEIDFFMILGVDAGHLGMHVNISLGWLCPEGSLLRDSYYLFIPRVVLVWTTLIKGELQDLEVDLLLLF